MTGPVLHFHSIHFERGDEAFGVPSAGYGALERSFKRLSRRSALMAGPGDTLILDQPLDPEYRALLGACGAGGRRTVTPHHNDGTCLADDVAACVETRGVIASWPGGIDLYMMSSAEERLGALIGRPMSRAGAPVTELLNDKVFFIRLLEDLGLPRIPTLAGPADAAAARIRNGGPEPIIVRGAKSVGGAQVWTARDGDERRKLSRLIERFRGKMFLVQPLIEKTHSPNLQFYVGEKQTCLLGRTVQIFERGLSHCGNLFDPVGDAVVDEALVEQGATVAREAATLGLRGLLGIDFIVSVDGEVFPVELNARHNTSTHALWFVNRLINGDPFLPVEPGRAAFVRFDAIRGPDTAMGWIARLGDDAFDPDTGTGVLPYDYGGDLLDALIVGEDRGHRARLIEKARMIAHGNEQPASPAQ